MKRVSNITALILIFGSGSLEFYLTNLKSDVKEHVEDKERQKSIIATGKTLEKELRSLVGSGRKIDAIKRFRAATGADLVMAKEVVEQLEKEV